MDGNKLQHEARNYESSTGMGTEGFHTKLPPEFNEERWWNSVGCWPEQTSTATFLWIPKNVTNEMPRCLFATLIRLLEWMDHRW